MKKIIGLTGGIGSGKTTVAKQFAALGVPVYIADDEAKKITEAPETILQIRKKFGPAVFDDDKLDRSKLAGIVFRSPEKLKELNAIIHPLVKQNFDEWLLNQRYPFVIKESAILFESGSYNDCDRIITVTAPLELRIQRVLKRDNSTREVVLQRINNQWTDEMKIAKSDFVIENTDLEITKNQINKVFSQLTII